MNEAHATSTRQRGRFDIIITPKGGPSQTYPEPNTVAASNQLIARVLSKTKGVGTVELVRPDGGWVRWRFG